MQQSGEERYLRGCALEIAALRSPDAQLRLTLLQQAAEEHHAAANAKRLNDDLIDGATSWRPRVRLGTISLIVGQLEAAGDAFAQARAMAPKQPAVRLGSIELALALNNNVEAMRALHEQHPTPLLDRHPDGWVLAAMAAEAGGLIEQMIALVEGAAELMSAGFLALHRAEHYDDLCALASIYRGEPAAGRGPFGQLASFMCGAVEADPCPRPPHPAMLHRMLRHAFRTGRADLIAPLLDTPAQSRWPNLAEAVNHALATLAQ